MAPLLCAGLQHDFVLAHGFDRSLTFVDGEREWLLGVNILLRRYGGDIDEGMPMIRRRLDNDVDVFPFEHFPEIRELYRHLFVFCELLRRGCGAAFVGVADRHDVTEPAGAVRIVSAHAAAADEGDAGAVVR